MKKLLIAAAVAAISAGTFAGEEEGYTAAIGFGVTGTGKAANNSNEKYKAVETFKITKGALLFKTSATWVPEHEETTTWTEVVTNGFETVKEPKDKEILTFKNATVDIAPVDLTGFNPAAPATWPMLDPADTPELTNYTYEVVGVTTNVNTSTNGFVMVNVTNDLGEVIYFDGKPLQKEDFSQPILVVTTNFTDIVATNANPYTVAWETPGTNFTFEVDAKGSDDQSWAYSFVKEEVKRVDGGLIYSTYNFKVLATWTETTEKAITSEETKTETEVIPGELVDDDPVYNLYLKVKLGKDSGQMIAEDIQVGTWDVFGNNYYKFDENNYEDYEDYEEYVAKMRNKFMPVDSQIGFVAADDDVMLYFVGFGKAKLQCDMDEYTWAFDFQNYNGWFVGQATADEGSLTVNDEVAADYDLLGGTWKATYNKKITCEESAAAFAGVDPDLEDEE